MTNIAVVIPCFCVGSQISDVISNIGPNVSRIYVIDDACPENSGLIVKENVKDPRVVILFHKINLGVGGAVVTGYKEALSNNADIIVKLDGDGQMDPDKIDELIAPIVASEADYTKGDRLDSLDSLSQMPNIRLIGNAGLSLLNKISSGYWNIKDPTNGFTAIHSDVLRRIPLDRLDKRYFFESDMLFRLSVVRAVVADVPIPAKYANERSNLSIIRSLVKFPWKLFINFHKRIYYNYYLRDISAASIELPVGTFLWWFGVLFGVNSFFTSIQTETPATTGTVMLSVLPLILGFQLLLAFLGYDIENVPSKPKHRQEK